MVFSLTIGWGIAIFLAVALLWVALSLWPRKPENDLFGVGSFIDDLFRTGLGLVGTILLMGLYIGLKLAGVC